MQVVRMILVDGIDKNSNKYYDMVQTSDTEFEVTYGRVGKTPAKQMYPMSKWDSVYKTRVKHGYTDVTGNAVISKVERELKIKDKDVRQLIDFLMTAAKTSIKEQYTVGVGQVSQKQIDAAQDLLGRLQALSVKDTLSVDDINKLLKDLYQTIPRKMKDTRSFFLKDPNHGFFTELLQNEQSLLDTLSTQVAIGDSTSEEIGLESLGLEIEVASQADRDRIAKETDFKVGNQRIFRVVNKKTESVFLKGTKTKLLYHGSKNANFLSILQNGLKVRPKGVPTTGSMLGDGIYLANKAQKSIGYTSLRGSYWANGSDNKAYLAIFEVNTGREWDLIGPGKRYESWMSGLNQAKVNAKGFDSIYAKGGADLRNDEYVIFEGQRCTIRYLIELQN